MKYTFKVLLISIFYLNTSLWGIAGLKTFKDIESRSLRRHPNFYNLAGAPASLCAERDTETPGGTSS